MNTNTLNISDIFNLHRQYENDIAAGQPLPIPPPTSPSERIKQAEQKLEKEAAAAEKEAEQKRLEKEAAAEKAAAEKAAAEAAAEKDAADAATE